MTKEYLVEYAFSFSRPELLVYLGFAFILGWVVRAFYKRSWIRRFWRYYAFSGSRRPYQTKHSYVEYIPEMYPTQMTSTSGYVPYHKNYYHYSQPREQIVVTEPVVPIVNKEALAKEKTPHVSELWEDLTIIEGIGPKIASVLSNAGVSNFRKLTDTPTRKIVEILESSGISPELHNPATWASQAYLALNRKWDELKKLQDELVRGKVNDI